MRHHQGGEALEAEIIARWRVDPWRGARARVRVATIDPGRGEAKLVGGLMIVKETLRHVQELMHGTRKLVFDMLDQVAKVPQRRLELPISSAV